jgi:hypothetical protein
MNNKASNVCNIAEENIHLAYVFGVHISAFVLQAKQAFIVYITLLPRVVCCSSYIIVKCLQINCTSATAMISKSFSADPWKI